MKLNLMNVCSDNVDNLWDGIKVNGSSDEPHKSDYASSTYILTTGDHGIVLLKNNSVIRDAKTGISVKNHDEWEWYSDNWGGYIRGDGARFVNNWKGVEFMKFKETNLSKFIDCEFVAEFGAAKNGVTIWETDGIEFSGCTFSDLSDNGIRTVDAAFTVNEGCTFERLENGVYATASKNLTRGEKVFIDGSGVRNLFEGCSNGVNTASLSNLEVIENDFTSTNIGVSTLGSSDYLVKDNTFSCPVYGVNSISSGTFFIRNNIWCNTYNDSKITGVRIEKNNGNTEINYETYNNESTKISQDILMTGSIFDKGTIRFKQGDNGTPASNKFTETSPITNGPVKIKSSLKGGFLVVGNLIIQTPVTNPFNYVHPDFQHLEYIAECSNPPYSNCNHSNNNYLNDESEGSAPLDCGEGQTSFTPLSDECGGYFNCFQNKTNLLLSKLTLLRSNEEQLMTL